MSRFSWVFLILFSLASLSIACQSEDEKRAARLREKLHQDIEQIEVVNNELLAAREKLYELMKKSKDSNAASRELQGLEKDRAQLPAELADLKSQIDTTPNVSLQMLFRGIRATLKVQQYSLKAKQSYLDSYVETWSPEALKKANEAWGKSLRRPFKPFSSPRKDQ